MNPASEITLELTLLPEQCWATSSTTTRRWKRHARRAATGLRNCAQQAVTDLRRAISINDKFPADPRQPVRGRRRGLHEKAIGVLNGCADSDDCMIYIAENYAWNPNSDGVKLLMDPARTQMPVTHSDGQNSISVPTPIGNLRHHAARAVNVLRSVDFILGGYAHNVVPSEASRHEQKPRSHHKFNEHATVRLVAESIAAGRDAAWCRTPVRRAFRTRVPARAHVRRGGDRIETLPGATALIPALVQSDFPATASASKASCPRRRAAASSCRRWPDEERTDDFLRVALPWVKCLEQFAEVSVPTPGFGVAGADQEIRTDRARYRRQRCWTISARPSLAGSSWTVGRKA